MVNSILPRVSLISFLLVLSLACKDDSNANPDNKFRIGVLLPLTGAASSTGESVTAAFNMALDDINEYLVATGRNLAVELVIKDTETNPVTALEALTDLNNESIGYIIGPYTSANAEAVLPYANEQELLLLSPSSVATTLAISGDNLYRLLPSDRAQAEAMVALLLHDSIELVIPIVRNDIWGTGLLSDATNIFSSNGVGMAEAIIYDPSTLNSVDIANQVAAAITLHGNNIPLGRIGVFLLSFGEGTTILSDASNIPENNGVKWYGSSAYANSNTIFDDTDALEFALSQSFKCPSFAPDPAMIDLWEPINTTLSNTLGRTPEVFALTSYDAMWLMVLAYVLADDPEDNTQFKSSLEELTGYYNGITGRTTLDENGDRKFASFNFWGIEQSGSSYDWKSFGYYRNADDQLVIF